MRMGIIGAGHAGVKAAETAAAQGAEVHLYSAEPVLPYYRPKLVGYAFGQSTLSEITMHEAAWYESRGIALLLNTPVTSCDLSARSLTSKLGTEKYDALIFATGSLPAVPPFARHALEHIHPLWHLGHAEDIRRLLSPGKRLAVVGGGILGVEVAHRAVLAGLQVVLVERLGHLMESNFGAEASVVVENTLIGMGVRLCLGTCVSSLKKEPAGDFHLQMDSGDSDRADMVILAVGARRDTSLPRTAGLKCGAGILVTAGMQTSDPSVFAGGDIVEWPPCPHFSVYEAVMQGKLAAANALAAAQGGAMAEHKSTDVPVSYTYEGFSLNSIGPACENGADEVALEHSAEIHRALLVKAGILIGIQMAGSSVDFRKYEKMIGKKL